MGVASFSALPIVLAAGTQELWVVSLFFWGIIVAGPLIAIAYVGRAVRRRWGGR